MLEFSDRARAIRVHRRTAADHTRTPVATINKATLAVVTDYGVAISEAEEAEIAEVVSLQRKAESLQRHLWTLRLPVLLREAVDFCEGAATIAEVKVLAHAVAEAHSRLRRVAARRNGERSVPRPGDGDGSEA